MVMSVLDYKTTRQWKEELVVNQKPRMTIQNYLWALQVFCDWVKKNPDELIMERLKEISQDTDFFETQTFKRIIEYQSKDRSKTKHSKAMIVEALTSFYEGNRASIGAIRNFDRKTYQITPR
jgi:hypothetical protein